MKYLTTLICILLFASCELTSTQKIKLRAQGKTIVKIVEGAAIQLTEQELAALAAQELK